MTATSEAYLMGIRDERRLLREAEAKGDYDQAYAEASLSNVKATLARGFAGDLRDYMRGSRDFWIGQVKRFRQRDPSRL